MPKIGDKPQDTYPANPPSLIAATYATYRILKAAMFFFILFLMLGILFIFLAAIYVGYACLGVLFILVAIGIASYILEKRS